MDIITQPFPMAPNGAKVMQTSDVMPTPFSPSWGYICSLPDWTKIRDILGGADQMRGRNRTIAGPSPSPGNAATVTCYENPYIQRYANESNFDYEQRVRHAPFENHFFDALDAVSDKPFTKPVVLRGDAPDDLIKFSEDVDGQGTSIHEFARSSFKEGSAFGIVGIFVDYPSLPDGATLDDQRKINARPYWIEIVAEDLLACQKASLNGKQYISLLRFVERREDSSGNVPITRMLRSVREYRHDGIGTPTFTTWNEAGAGEWTEGQSGSLKGMTAIPFKEFLTGRRDRYTGRIISPMLALADLQIEHFDQNCNLKHVMKMAAFPMLCGNGVNPPTDPVTGQPLPLPTGPGAVLYAPLVSTGTKIPEWKYLEPSGSSIKALMEGLDRLVAAIDKLGKAPLVKSTGRVTATSDAISAAKGHATAEVWAALLGDALSAAFDFTAQYMGIALSKPVEVEINTEFGIEDGNIADGTELRNSVTSGLISRETYWDELRRRSILGSGFDPKLEVIRLKDDQKEKMSQQEATLALNAKFAPPGTGGAAADDDGASSAPPPGSSPGPSNDADYIRTQSDSNLSMN